MEKELIDRLYHDFPNLYKDHTKWGFGCRKGWFKLIYDMSAKIEELICSLPEEERWKIRASQTKEKFGSLRFYIDDDYALEDERRPNGIINNIDKLIDKAETESSKICEFCGEPGHIRSGGWIKTLCDNCYKEREEEKRILNEKYENRIKEVK